MKIHLTALDGPMQDRTATFSQHSAIVLGTAPTDAESLPDDLGPDRVVGSFAKRFFWLEVFPPRARIVNLGGDVLLVNRNRIALHTLVKSGDEISVGPHTFKITEEITGTMATTNSTQVQMSLPLSMLAAKHPEPWKPEGIDKFEPIGEGWMGEVYHATRQGTGDAIAIRIYNASQSCSADDAKNFITSYQPLTTLEHPNIARCQKIHLSDGRVVEEMDFIKGTDLGRLTRKLGTLDVASAVRSSIAILDALEYAHGRGILHNDLKPANVYLTTDPAGKKTIKIADFGTAFTYQHHGLDGPKFLCEARNSSGPEFYAPERLSRITKHDARADLYSVGAMLYFMLTGEFVYDFAQDPIARLVQLLTTDPTPIETRKADLPPKLCKVVMKSLAHDPNHRYQTATEFRTALTE